MPVYMVEVTDNMKKWTVWMLVFALTAALLTPGSRAVGEKKLVALTFDDGPSQYTDKLLDSLARYDAKATFFVSGYRLDSYDAELQRIADEGHEIGNHTQNHKTLTKLSAETLAYEIDSTLRTIKAVAGDTAYLLRPVGGAYNTRVCEAARGPVILWSARHARLEKPRRGLCV
ncbi:MAG: polysaccharide deacetylase family protein [Clostridiaceae bacterium]|nr:polysaccharide deacetylase family protein [Clostridiaceae bacterium]